MPKQPELSVALLRGINVGGKNILPMKGLAALFTELGCTDVQTYIQSGNVVFRAAEKLRADQVTARIAERFGIQSPVILRTRGELAAAIANNPFPPDPDGKLVHVMFLSAVAAAEGIAKLDPQRSPPDEFAVRGQEIYLKTPNGAGNTKLTNAYFDSKLKVISTARNWRTVLKLLELTCPP